MLGSNINGRKIEKEENNTMKRILALILAAMMLFTLTGCGMEALLSGLGGESPEGVKNT